MAQRLLEALTRSLSGRRRRRLVVAAGIGGLALTITALAAAVAPQPVKCAGGVCQCWYCPSYHWGDDDGDGDSEFYCDSACTTGCVGNCDSGACRQVPGQGGCGPVCSCRQSDCAVEPVPTENPPTVVPTPTAPPPPADCPGLGEKRKDTRLIPPTIGEAKYRPDHPVAVEQDPNRTGFELHLVFRGGRYEYKTQELEEWCGPAGAGQSQGRHPANCPNGEWHYECPWRCVECFDDPLDTGQVRMRLADPTVDWIQKDLAARYPGAQLKEGLPRVWQLAGLRGRMAYDAWWQYAPGSPDKLSNGPIDPGIHGGQIWVWTIGTPKSEPQLVKRAFEVPVYLLDTTIAR